MKCECGNEEFYGHQKCRMDVVVDGDGNWLRNSPDDNSSCYDAENPYGPFRCTKCNKEYEELVKCPVCDTLIPNRTKIGQSCKGCGHLFV